MYLRDIHLSYLKPAARDWGLCASAKALGGMNVKPCQSVFCLLSNLEFIILDCNTN